MLADTVGNTGSQSATLIIRGLAPEELSLRNSVKILVKESVVSIMLDLSLAAWAFMKVCRLSSESAVPQSTSLAYMSWIIDLALFVQVITATRIGAVLPLVAERLKIEPVNVATPLLTTLVDITDLLIFFKVAVWLYRLRE